MIKNIDSIIFDLDGTLWDSCETVAKAWQSALKAGDYGQAPLTADDVRSIAGLPYDVIYHKLFPSLTQEQREELKANCAKEELIQVTKNGGRLYDNLEDTLQYLRNKYRLFIVSNCQSGYIEGFMEHHKLQQYFEDSACFGDANRPKAENIQEIIRRNNVKSAVYVGDTEGDRQAAITSGIPFIYARYGFGKLENQEYTINRIQDLKELF